MPPKIHVVQPSAAENSPSVGVTAAAGRDQKLKREQQQKGPAHQSAAGIWPGWLFFAAAAADGINMPEIRPINRVTD